MATLDELVLRIRADASQLERELKKATATTEQSTRKMSGAFGDLTAQVKALAPALSAVAVVAFAKNALASADRINDLSLRIGVLGSTLSALDVPLQQAGTSLEEFTGALGRMNNMLGEAAKSPEAVKAFDDLGLSVEKLLQLTPEKQFYEIAHALSGVEDQSRFTEIGMNIFGKSFVALAPLIRQTGGDLEEFVNKQKELGNALTEEELARIDLWGDRWVAAVAKMKLGVVDYLNYFYELGEEHRRQIDDAGLVLGSYTRPKVLTDEEAAKSVRDSARKAGLDVPGEPSARGSNAELLKKMKDRSGGGGASKENDILKERKRLVEMNMTAYEKYQAGVAHANKILAGDQATLNRELSRLQKEFTDETTQGMDKAKDATQELAVSIRDSLANSFEDALFEAENFSDAMGSILDGIARQIARKAFIDPASNAIGGLIGDVFGGGLDLGGLFGETARPSGDFVGPMPGGIFSGLGFADGGRPPVGKVSIVGENGPELFMPDSAGTVIPNGQTGGVVVNQTFNISPGVPELVRKEMMQTLPYFAEATKSSLLSDAKRGGQTARILGSRN